MGTKTVTIREKDPLDIPQNLRILYGVREADGNIRDHVVAFRLKGAPLPEEEHPERPGAMILRNLPYGMKDGEDKRSENERVYRVERTLNVGDSIFFTAPNGPTLRKLVEKSGRDPDACDIGAFWEVQEDGRLVCTGT